MAKHAPAPLDADAITPDPDNPNRGTQRGEHLLETSISRLGAGRSILVDADGKIIAGNHAWETAKRLGLNVRVVDAEGDELIAVRRPDLRLDDPDDLRARELSIADNRTAQVNIDLATDVIAAHAARGVDVDRYWFADELIAAKNKDDQDHAGDFLAPFLEADNDDDTAESALEATSRQDIDDDPLVTFAVSCTTGQRMTILKAVSLAKGSLRLNTTQDALVAICEAYRG